MTVSDCIYKSCGNLEVVYGETEVSDCIYKSCGNLEVVYGETEVSDCIYKSYGNLEAVYSEVEPEQAQGHNIQWNSKPITYNPSGTAPIALTVGCKVHYTPNDNSRSYLRIIIDDQVHIRRIDGFVYADLDATDKVQKEIEEYHEATVNIGVRHDPVQCSVGLIYCGDSDFVMRTYASDITAKATIANLP